MHTWMLFRIKFTMYTKHYCRVSWKFLQSGLKNKLTGVVERPRMTLEIFQHHNDQVKALVGNEFAPLTYKRYKTALEHTKEFIQWKFRISDLDITKLNYEFIHDFEFYLKSVRKCGHNTAIKYLSNF